jgi:formylglycine-generating enzyme required for sulfatase activity/tRNA A-37 threonylcarbamoyl transferase component Bud32
MSADPTATFLDALRASRLLADEQIRDITGWIEQNRPDVPALAKEINRRGWLTVYQIKEIARGRGAGLILGNFIIQDLLGEGGMGRVFKAHNTRLGRDEALKVIRADKLKSESAQSRFTLEMQALGKVKHPNVVTAFDAGPMADLHFVSMEFIDGFDLTRMVRDRGPMPFPLACEYIRQAALGLQHASELGMVHRDIKPSNILVSRDGKQVKLVDLGLARLNEPVQQGANRVTQEGFVIGTPDFLAPEQARNPGGVDIRADIYALGSTLFFCLTGRVPYDGAGATEKLLKHCTEPPPNLIPHRPDCPPQLEQLIHWCMAKAPEHRPQTPLQLALALQPFCPSPPPGTGLHRVVPPAANLLPPVAKNDPNSSSQIFKLPAQSNDADPIRRRARGGFPWSFALVGFGILILAGILAYGGWRALQVPPLPPVEGFTNFADMKMVKIDGGTFEMGSKPTEHGRAEPQPRQPDDESPVHPVTIHGPFLMSATEVTHNQWMRVMGTSPAQSIVVKRAANASEHPVDFVSYEDALEFCKRLTEKEAEKKLPHVRPGWSYRLPTEAEWEYCCRAGTHTPFSVGDRLSNIPRIGGALQPGGRFLPTGDEKEAELEGNTVKDVAIEGIPGRVGQYEPNAFGLFDMHGNIAEWCQDWYRRGYSGSEPRENPTGPGAGERRVVRGGSFRDPASACRSAARNAFSPTDRRATVGFRIVYAPKQ